MPKVIITVGIPASGKSTWAREYARENNAVIACRDDIRTAHGWTEYGNPKTEARITAIEQGQIEAALLNGQDVVVADTNVQKDFRKKLVKFAHRHGADVEIKTFPISLDEAIWRDSQRPKPVGADVINRMYNKLQSQDVQDESLPVQRFEPYKHNPDLEDIICVDIDGTVAKHVARSPYDYSKVLTDEVIWDVASIILHLAEVYEVYFVSGRKASCKDDTKAWLDKWFFGPYTLLMREANDERPDWIIKNEIYDRDIIPFKNIKMVFDDRDQVVTHLRARGITVAQVAPGRF